MSKTFVYRETGTIDYVKKYVKLYFKKNTSITVNWNILLLRI